MCIAGVMHQIQRLSTADWGDSPKKESTPGGTPLIQPGTSSSCGSTPDRMAQELCVANASEDRPHNSSPQM